MHAYTTNNEGYKIWVVNRQQYWLIQTERLRQLVSRCLSSLGILTAELEITLVDDPIIHRYNKEYLQHDWPTDVISFDLGTVAASPAYNPSHLHGSLMISAETAVRVANELGHSPDVELLLYAIHGLLHLCGFDDQTAEQASIMRCKEQELLALCGCMSMGSAPVQSPADSV